MKLMDPATFLQPDTVTEITVPAKRGRGRVKQDRTTRFNAKIDRSAGVNACHPWTASLTQADGYPQFWDVNPDTGKNTMRRANRVALEIKLGRSLRKDEIVLHAQGCSKTCCNGKHLRIGTYKENTADARIEKKLTGPKLNEKQVRTIVKLMRDGYERCHISERFGICYKTINLIMTGRTWGDITGIELVVKKSGGQKRPVTVVEPVRQRRGKQLEHGAVH